METEKTRRIERLSRLLRLNRLLQQRGGRASSNHLCQELRVSPRTLQRDISALRESGETVEYSKKHNRYRTAAAGETLLERLTLKQLAALLARLEGHVPTRGSDFDVACSHAGQAIREFLEKQHATTMRAMQPYLRIFRGDQRR
jgi:predicted DNA-binding transcriptional regulator YafY